MCINLLQKLVKAQGLRDWFSWPQLCTVLLPSFLIERALVEIAGQCSPSSSRIVATFSPLNGVTFSQPTKISLAWWLFPEWPPLQPQPPPKWATYPLTTWNERCQHFYKCFATKTTKWRSLTNIFFELVKFFSPFLSLRQARNFKVQEESWQHFLY